MRKHGPFAFHQVPQLIGDALDAVGFEHMSMQLPQIAGLHHLAVDHVALHRPAILHAASHYRKAFRTKAVSSGGRIWERVLAPGPFPSPLTNSSGQKFEAIEKRGVASVGNSLAEAPSPNRLAWLTNEWG